MRRARGGKRGPLTTRALLASALALAGVAAAGAFFAASLAASHDPQHAWSGTWELSSATGPPGSIDFQVIGDADGLAAMNAINPTVACKEPSDYYVGVYNAGSDSGKVAGCTLGNSIYVNYKSKDGAHGYILVTIGTAGDTFSGENWIWNDAASVYNFVGRVNGTFIDHFYGDGAAAQTSATQPQTGTQPPAETQPADTGPIGEGLAPATQPGRRYVNFGVRAEDSFPVFGNSVLTGAGNLKRKTRSGNKLTALSDAGLTHTDKRFARKDLTYKLDVVTATITGGGHRLNLVVKVARSNDPDCDPGTAGFVRLISGEATGGQRSKVVLQLFCRSHLHTWEGGEAVVYIVETEAPEGAAVPSFDSQNVIGTGDPI